MKRAFLFLAIAFFSLATVSSAENPRSPAELTLTPQPKEVQLHDGSFRVRAATRILVPIRHQAEDRIAAETLAEDIQDQSGLQIKIIGSKEKGKQQHSTIELARLQDRSVGKFLRSKGLTADSIGDEGYVLFSDRFRLVVAANTGQGLFYGVQTLRQLLREDDGKLVCPSVSIRDWPSMEWRGVQDHVSRGPTKRVFDFASQPLVAQKEAALASIVKFFNH
jgi:hexosaminidase